MLYLWKFHEFRTKLTCELYRPSGLRLSGKLVPTFVDRGCHVLSVTYPYCRILDFLDRSCYFFFQVAPQLYSRGWVDPVPDPLLLKKSGSAGNRTRTSGSVTRNSDHYTTVVVEFRIRAAKWKVKLSLCSVKLHAKETYGVTVYSLTHA
jgi:hypothetical protein